MVEANKKTTLVSKKRKLAQMTQDPAPMISIPTKNQGVNLKKRPAKSRAKPKTAAEIVEVKSN